MPRTKDYCQYLLSSQKNYTLTHYAAHVEGLSHDRINRHLARIRVRPQALWEEVKDEVVRSERGFLVFDDTVLDKRYSRAIEPVRSQYSGNAHGIIRGMGVVTCLYVNPDIDQFWAIDWRLFDPDTDGKTKLDHVRDMLLNAHHHKALPYRAVLMDTWYATTQVMLLIAKDLGKVFYCPLRSNRLVNDSDGALKNKPVAALEWREDELINGKRIKIKGFPVDCIWQLFRIIVSPNRTDHVVTNDKACGSSDDVRKTCANRWKIEQLHREIKQLCGIEQCQCRKGRIQRNHIACAFLVWARLKQIAYKTAQTVYQIKQNLLKDYLAKELKNPSVMFIPA
jgi:hypothetical protein